MGNAYYPEQNLSAVYIQERQARTARKGAKKADLEACSKGGRVWAGGGGTLHWYKAVGMQMHTFSAKMCAAVFEEWKAGFSHQCLFGCRDISNITVYISQFSL